MNEQNLLAERKKARIEEDLETSRESLDDLTRSIEASSQVNQQLLDEKARIEQDIEEALRIQKEMREYEELRSMRERELIDYPDFEEDGVNGKRKNAPANNRMIRMRRSLKRKLLRIPILPSCSKMNTSHPLTGSTLHQNLANREVHTWRLKKVRMKRSLSPSMMTNRASELLCSCPAELKL